MQAVAYIRVSTEGQAQEGVSLEAQEAKIRAYCRLNDLDLVAVFVDAGVSAKRADNRPELQRALKAAGKGKASALVVYKLDRLARNTVDALEIAERLDRQGVTLHSITEKLDTGSAVGRFFFTLLASLAEMERGIISERTAAAHAHKRSKGEPCGHPPFGYDVRDGLLVPNQAEQATMARINALLARGTSQRKLVVILNREGLPAKRGGTWTRASLRSVIASQERWSHLAVAA